MTGDTMRGGETMPVMAEAVEGATGSCANMLVASSSKPSGELARSSDSLNTPGDRSAGLLLVFFLFLFVCLYVCLFFLLKKKKEERKKRKKARRKKNDGGMTV